MLRLHRILAYALIAACLAQAAMASGDPFLRRARTSTRGRRRNDEFESDVEYLLEDEAPEGELAQRYYVLCPDRTAECLAVRVRVEAELALYAKHLAAEWQVRRGWRFVILDEPAWQQLINKLRWSRPTLENGRSIFTVMDIDTTYIRLWQYHKREDSKLRNHLIHEGVHITHGFDREQWVIAETQRLQKLLTVRLKED